MINFSFRSTVLAEDVFQVVRFEGEEEISRLFRFEIYLVSRDPNIDLSAVLDAQAYLSLSTHKNTRYFHGMLAVFEQGGRLPDDLYCYRAILVPRIWILTQSRQNQIYQKKTIPQIVENELLNTDNKGSHPILTEGMKTDDYAVLMSNDYPEREYVVQYDETDLNFVSRLMEHEGIFYFFEHSDSQEKWVIADSNIEFPNVAGSMDVPYKDVAGSLSFESAAIHEFTRIHRHIPNKVLLKDFNYREPHVTMQADNIVDDFGIGLVAEYGAHFKTPEEGVDFAKIRAEEFQCVQNVYVGKSNNGVFSSGHLYALTEHFRDDFNQNYLLTKVKHIGSQEIETWNTIGNTQYYNEFNCISAEIAYRPERITPKPKLYGVMNGIIDSEQEGLNRADIDEYGRYKVLMPFDISGVGPGKASRRIRMAQPYGGSQQGMSFPLAPGTEVIWTCIDGDLDRPIITGAVPNPLNPSVTNAENSTSNVIRTASGISLNFNDGSSGSGGNSQGQSGEALTAQQQNQRILTDSTAKISSYKTRDQYKQIKSPTTESTENKVAATPLLKTPLTEQQQQSDFSLSSGWQVGQDIYETDTNFQIYVPYVDNDGDPAITYLRLGNKDGKENLSKGETNLDGWMDYTDGERTQITKGNIHRYNYSFATDYFYNEQFNYATDSTYNFYQGHVFDANSGGLGELTTGVKSSANLGINMNLDLAANFNFGTSFSYSTIQGDSIELADNIDQEANKSISLLVDPEDSGLDAFMESTAPKVAAVTAGIASALSIAAAAGEGALDSKISGALNEPKACPISRAAAYSMYAISLGLTAAAVVHAIKRKTDDNPASTLKMEEKTVLLECVGTNASRGDHKTITLHCNHNDGAASDNKAVILEVQKNSDDKGHVELRANKAHLLVYTENDNTNRVSICIGDTSVITASDDEIVLRNGASEVIISDAGISFEGNIIFKGDIEQKSGTLKTADVIECKKLKTESFENPGAVAKAVKEVKLKEKKYQTNLAKFLKGQKDRRQKLYDDFF